MTAEHYEALEAELFGAWVAVKAADTPPLTQAFALPADPLREGSVSDSRLIPEFHAERERDARKKKRAAAVDQTPTGTPTPTETTDNYYEEY